MKELIEEHSPTSPARRLLTLGDCVFICCLPLKQDSFERLWAVSEFCSRFDSWSEYKSALDVDRRSDQLAMLSELGLRGTEAARIRDFSRAINDRPLLIALLGHCRGRKEIEFAGGFVSLKAVASEIPTEFSGVLDVSVCKPSGFVREAKLQADSSFVRTARAKSSGKDYLLFYVTLFTNVARLGQYGASLISTLSAFSKARLESERGPFRW